MEIFASSLHTGDLAKEGDFLLAIRQLGHAAFGQTDLAHEAHVQQSGEKLSGVALLLRRGRTQLYCGGTAIHANTSSRHVGLHRLRTGADGPRLDPAAVTEAGLTGADPDAAAALNLFSKFLGRVCGDLALTFLATGGVYIGGGIAPRIIDVLRRGAFRAAFEYKPPFVAQMDAIPTSVIAVHDPALTGLAALASQPDRFDYHGQVWQAP